LNAEEPFISLRAVSAPSPTPDLSQQLASLRLSRDETPRPSGGGWLKVILISLGALAVVGALAVALRNRLDVKSAETVPVLLVQAGQEAPLFVATGTVTAPVTATLAPRTAGRLLRLLVQEGDEVAQDQPVALLDPTDPKLALTQAKADLASAEAKLAAAQATVHTNEVHQARAATLFKGGAGTESAAQDAALDLDSARAQVQVSQADVGLSRSRLATAEKNLEDTTLKAPFRGVVLKTLAQPGDFVSTATSQGVLQLADLGSMEVDAEVAEANLAKLTQTMPVDVRLDALPGQGIAGKVFSIRPNVDIAKATAIAKVRLNPPPGSLKIPLFPGMNGRVNFLAHAPDAAALQKAPQIEVPAGAVVRTSDQSEVYTVDKDGLVAAAKVTTAGLDGERVILKDGPAAGTLILASPEGIKPGDRVKQADK
jgi:RND family efflux transporter MFP subunit